MREICTSGSMSGEGKRSDWQSLKPPRLSSTLPTRRVFTRLLSRCAPAIRPAGSVWGHSLCNAFGIDLPRSAARRGPRPRGSWAGRHQAEGDGPEQRPFRATRRQLDADARDVFDHARADLDQAFSDGRELATGERVGPRDRGAHAVHQPERGSMENEPHLIGRRAVARHPIRRQLSFVQLDQVLHLAALAIDVIYNRGISGDEHAADCQICGKQMVLPTGAGIPHYELVKMPDGTDV